MLQRTLALTLLLVVCPIGVRAEPGAAHLLPENLENVLHVRCGDSTGTAFLLRHRGARYLVTARHVVAAHMEDPSVPVGFHVGGKRGRVVRTARLHAQSRRADIAVFAFDDDARVPLFAPEAGLVPHDELHLAQQVFLVGYPASLRRTYGASSLRVVGGWVAGLKKYVPGSTVEYVDIDMPGVEHGHSGGPILVLPDRVVAVAVQRRTGSVTDTIGATYAVPIKYVTALLEEEPVPEDTKALEEALRGTSLVCGVARHGKDDYDVWTQRVHRDTGEGVWGDVGVFLASSTSQESTFRLVPSDHGSVLVVHGAYYPANADHDILVQKLSRYGELVFEGGMQSRPVAVRGQPERGFSAVTDGEDGALVVYEMHLPDGNVEILGQRISPQGDLLWKETGAVVASASNPERRPTLVPDGAGGALVALESHLPNGDIDVVAQRVLADGTLAWHDGTRSVDVGNSQFPEFAPRALSDGAGGALLFYEIELADGRRVLVAQRLSPHGDLLWNDGEKPTLVSPRPLAGGARGVSVLPDGLGGAFVAMEVYSDVEKLEDVDVAVQRVSRDGRVLWGRQPGSDAVVPVLAASSHWPERKPVLQEDGLGGVVVAFEVGSEEGDTDVMAQRVDGEGRLRWNDGMRSTAVARTFFGEGNPRIVERHRDRVLVMFEVVRENGRSAVACQALTVETGEVLYGGGKFPVAVVDAGDTDINCFVSVSDRAD